MKVKFKTQTQNESNCYSIHDMTKEELAAYKAAKGSYYREDENGTPLYFTKRALSSTVDYKMDDQGYIISTDVAASQALIDQLAVLSNVSISKSQLRAMQAQKLMAEMQAEL